MQLQPQAVNPPPDQVKLATGAVRGASVAGEGEATTAYPKFTIRYDLLNPTMLRRVAMTFGEGSGKYGDHNWWKGMDEKTMLNHGLAHIFAWMRGDKSEDHLAHAVWNFGNLMHFEETRPDLMNLQQAIKETQFYIHIDQRGTHIEHDPVASILGQVKRLAESNPSLHAQLVVAINAENNEATGINVGGTGTTK